NRKSQHSFDSSDPIPLKRFTLSVLKTIGCDVYSSLFPGTEQARHVYAVTQNGCERPNEDPAIANRRSCQSPPPRSLCPGGQSALSPRAPLGYFLSRAGSGQCGPVPPGSNRDAGALCAQ